MKSLQNTFFSILLIIFPIITFGNTQISQIELDNQIKEGNILSDGFPTLQECTTTKDQYNIEFPSYKRSNCFLNNTKYYYFICQTGTACSVNITEEKSTNISSSTSTSQDVPYKAKLDTFLTKVSALQNEINNDTKYAATLDQILVKLNILATKYKSNNVVTPMISYLELGVTSIKQSLSNNEEGVDDFFCELLENCGNNTSSSTVSTTTNTAIANTVQSNNGNSFEGNKKCIDSYNKNIKYITPGGDVFGRGPYGNGGDFRWKYENWAFILSPQSFNDIKTAQISIAGGVPNKNAPQENIGNEYLMELYECINGEKVKVNSAQGVEAITMRFLFGNQLLSQDTKEQGLIEYIKNNCRAGSGNAIRACTETEKQKRVDSTLPRIERTYYTGLKPDTLYILEAKNYSTQYRLAGGGEFTYNNVDNYLSSISSSKNIIINPENKETSTSSIQNNTSSQNNVQNQIIGSCSGTLPTGEGIISCGADCSDFAPRNTTWKYSQGAQTACTWGCESGYVRPSLSANYCVKSDTPIYDGNDISFEIKASSNCSTPGSSLSVTLWNAGPDIKICQEYELTTPSRKGEKNSCDSDSKFVPASQAWPNGFHNGSWNKYETLINHTSIVPGKYRLVVKSTDGKVKYSDWYTIATSGNFSNPENCHYTKYKPNSVEDALWFLLNTKDVHWTYGIDYTNLTSKCPNINTEFIKLAQQMSGYWKYYQSPSIGGNGRTLGAELSHCYTRQVPTWTGSTFIGDFGGRFNGQKNNEANFDFQSWYNGGNPWTLGGSGCGSVPLHGKSQFYGGIKWESGKEFNCTAKTYGGTTPASTTTGGNTITNFSVSQSKATLKENADVITLTVTGLDYDTAMACHAVIAHPYVPSAVNPTYCNNNSGYVYLKNVSSWNYANGVWTASMKSDTTLYLSGIKVQSYFMNGKTGEKKSLPIIEIIK